MRRERAAGDVRPDASLSRAVLRFVPRAPVVSGIALGFGRGVHIGDGERDASDEDDAEDE